MTFLEHLMQQYARKVVRLSTTTLALALTSCVGTETGNPDTARVEVQFFTSMPERIATNVNELPTELHVSAGVVSGLSLSFMNCQEELIHESLDLQFGLGVPITLQLPPGEVCAVTVAFEETPQFPTPGITLLGFLPDGIEVAVILPLPAPTFLRGDGRPLATLDSGEGGLLRLDLAELLQPNVLSDLGTNNDRMATVSPDSNNAFIADMLYDALPDAFSFEAE